MLEWLLQAVAGILRLQLTQHVFLSAFVIALTGLICWMCEQWWQYRFFRRRGIPGPPPKLFVGNLTEFWQDHLPDKNIARWLKQYGNIFGYFMGRKPFMVIKDLEVIKTIAIKDFNKFVPREPMPIPSRPLTESLLFTNHQRWREVRKMMTPTFSAVKMKQMAELMNRSIDILVQKMENHAKDQRPFDLFDDMQRATLDVISECILAMRVNCQQDSGDAFLTVVTEFIHLCNNGVMKAGYVIPGLGSILAFIHNRIAPGKLTTMVVRNLRKVIRNRRENIEQPGTDVLQLLLTAKGDKDFKGEAVIPEDEIIANAYMLLLAGYETTAHHLSYTFYHLAKNQDVQERLYQEICQKLPDTEKLTYDDVFNLTYLDQVLSESLRVSPPVTLFINRLCTEDCDVGPVTIPKGCIVMVPLWHLHHDPDIWPDPETFDPERFSPDNRSKHHPAAWMPFGLGPKNCIGRRFAQLEAKLAVSRIIRRFRILPCDKTDPLRLVSYAVAVVPLEGVNLVAQARDKDVKN